MKTKENHEQTYVEVENQTKTTFTGYKLLDDHQEAMPFRLE
jgi:hypothetical protein